MTVTSEDKYVRVRATWALACIDEVRFAQVFYATLFRNDPSTKPLFVGDISLQGRKLSQTLTFIIDNLDEPDKLVPAAVELAKRHVGYGVSVEQYDSVGEALISALAQIIGSKFTPEDKKAWVSTYTTLKDAMIQAAYPT